MNRAEVVLLFVLLFLLVLAGAWWGWRGRARRQSAIGPLPTPPVEFGSDLLAPLSGLYVGTTISAEWQNRVVVHTLGERADASLRLSEAGALIERQGAHGIFIPAAALIDARLEPALAGKVVGKGGLLVLRWQHGDVLLDTGLRADDKSRYPDWVNAIGRRGQEPDAVTTTVTVTDSPTEEAGSSN